MLPGSRYVRSHYQFVGFPSIQQTHHNCVAAITEMEPCKFAVLRSISQMQVKYMLKRPRWTQNGKKLKSKFVHLRR